MPSYAGLNLFGAALQLKTGDNPRASQRNAYSGLSGVEHLDQGLRGRYTECDFWFVFDFVADLNAAELQFRSFNDGLARVLVDNFGNAWDDVLLDSFEPTTKIYVNAGTGGVLRKYRARFEHLS